MTEVNDMKKLLSLLISTVMLLQVFVLPASANNTPAIPAEHVEEIGKTIAAIAHEKEMYGLGNADLTALQIGNAIPAYEVDTNNQINELTSMVFYPIFDENENLKVIATVVFDEETGDWASISAEMVDFLSARLDTQNAALVYDKYGVYFNNGAISTWVTDNGEENGLSFRGELADVALAEYTKINAEEVAPCYVLDVSQIATPAIFDNYSVWLSVGHVPQPASSGWCWAGCMASIINYLKGTSYSCANIATDYVDTNGQGASITQVRTWFTDFNLYFSRNTNGTSLSNLVSSLRGGTPVYGSFEGGEGHAMVIRGVDFGNNTFSVMDPALRTGTYYRTGNILNPSGTTATFRISSTSGAVTYTMRDYLYR